MEKCGYCGKDFNINESKVGCSGCPMGSSCGKIKCPYCNYEMPAKPKMPKLIYNIFQHLK
jgi:hypothetical protein